MTRINTTPAAIRKPDSVLFGELAIAAGMTGNPVAVCFSESAAVVDCELWKYLAQCAGPGRAMHVHSQIDVRKLTKAVGSCPLVVVHAPRLFNTVAWTVQMHGSQTSARPAIFTRMVPNSLEDVPIPILVLRNTPDESSSILRWLMAGCPQRACLPDVQPTNGITLDPALSPVTIPSKLSNGRGPTKLRDCQLLTALLSGACLTNNAEQAPELTDSATCGQREYERVRRLLQSPLVEGRPIVVHQHELRSILLRWPFNDRFCRVNSAHMSCCKASKFNRLPWEIRVAQRFLRSSVTATSKRFVAQTRRPCAAFSSGEASAVEQMLEETKSCVAHRSR
jgi:hypothetical protein